MPTVVHSKELSVKRERVITEIRVDGKFTVSVGCVVRERNTGGERGIVFKLHDPEEYAHTAIVVCWFSGQTGTFSVDDFNEQCEVLYVKN